MPYPTRPANNYCVRKWSDVDQYLNAEERRLFIELIVKIDTARMSRQITNRDYVVVSNKNRQMYEEVWGMVMGESSLQESRQENMFSGNIWDQVRNMARNPPTSVGSSPTMRTLRMGVNPSDGRVIWADEIAANSDARTMTFDTEQMTVSDVHGNTRIRMGRVSPSMEETEASIERAWERQNEPMEESVEEDELAISYDVGVPQLPDVPSQPSPRNVEFTSWWAPGTRWRITDEGGVVQVRQSSEETDFVDVD